jgi:hypothetical protein
VDRDLEPGSELPRDDFDWFDDGREPLPVAGLVAMVCLVVVIALVVATPVRVRAVHGPRLTRAPSPGPLGSPRSPDQFVEQALLAGSVGRRVLGVPLRPDHPARLALDGLDQPVLAPAGRATPSPSPSTPWWWWENTTRRPHRRRGRDRAPVGELDVVGDRVGTARRAVRDEPVLGGRSCTASRRTPRS